MEGQIEALDSPRADLLEARRVAEALGAEAAQVLDAANVAAVERGERAGREADALVTAASEEADAVRVGADLEREEILAEARRRSEELVEEGRTVGRGMVHEAQVVRERMLGDLARKRQTGRAQVEQLRAGRDRLLESLVVVQRSLDDAVKDLTDAVPEARAAAERAGLRVAEQPTPTVEVIEADIEAARLVGHPLLEGVPTPDVLEIEEPPTPDPAFVTGEMEALTHVDAALHRAEAEEEPPDDAGEPDLDDSADPEPEVDLEPEVDPEPEVDLEPEVDHEPELELEPAEEVEEDGGDVVAEPVDDLFARLRRARDADDADDGLGHGTASTPEPDEPDRPEPIIAPDDEAIERAGIEALRAVKKVLVNEQGSLLDGIRLEGAEAIRVVIGDVAAHAAPYEDAVEPALRDLAIALGGDAAVARRAVGHVQEIALDPVCRRLREVIERTDDVDEISTTVRGLYRETRSRRLSEAVDAAVVFVRGAVSVSRAAGSVRWQIDPAGSCGADCAGNAAAGAIPAGAAFPSGVAHPPAGVGCTCSLVDA